MKNKKSKFKINNILKSKVAKFSLLFLSSVAALSLFLTGCNKNKDKSSGDKIEITFWSHKAENDAAIKKIASDFEKSHNNVKINVSSIGGSIDYIQQLKAAVASGKLPDIFNLSSFGEMLEFKDHIRSVEDMPILSQINSRWLGGATDFDGKLYGIPECIEGFGFVANSEMFKAAGVDTESLKTWDGIKSGCEKADIAKNDPSSELMKKFPNLKSIWLVPLQEAWVQGNHAGVPFINMDFYTENVKITNKNEASDPIHKAYNSDMLPGNGFPLYKQYIDFIIKYAQPTYKADDYSATIDRGLFGKQGAITQQGTWIFQKLKEFYKSSGSNIKDEFVFLPFSTPGGKTDNKYVAYAGQYIMCKKDMSDKKYQVVKELIDYFFSSEDYTKSCDFISPLKNSNQIFQEGSFNNTLKKAIDEDNTIPGDLSVIRTEAFHKNVLGTSIQKYAQSDLSDNSWEQIVVKPAKESWTKITSDQKKQNNKNKK